MFGKGCSNDYPLQTVGGKQNISAINEPATTFLISRSNTEVGKKLNRWIHAEVLPAIRKTGSNKITKTASVLKEMVKLHLIMKRMTWSTAITKVKLSIQQHSLILQKDIDSSIQQIERFLQHP